ncbi:protoglobin domain-containing protein [Paenibacillus pseudetheri]|uniref:Heme-based aerotactic transducer HemAT n=1 Tax=Paenibacillus pseudetheri TaxID=2897682 RepID=A0ABN8FQ20_9BACL|nr:globin-coupled sensor protein [Paenibacillus pseudetheri]CAH1058522.1 Heme-based aerotactic transducer HemAT [Paenibacillus pseudetheri]
MGKCPFSFLHALTARNNNVDSPASHSLDLKHQSKYAEESFHKLEGYDELNEQMRMIDLSESDLNLLRRVKPSVEKNIDYIIDQFYNSVLGMDKLEAIILEHSSIERLKTTLREHIIEIFAGKVDEEYISKRMKFANIHKRVGLEPKWYLSAFQNLQNVFKQVIYNETHDDNIRLHLVKTVTKLLNLEQQLVLEEYEKENVKEKEQQYLLVKNELKQKIAEFSSELIDFSIDTNAAVKQLVASSNEVSRTFQRTATSAVESQGLAADGHEHLDSLTGQINLIYQSTSQMEHSVQELSNSSNQIQKNCKFS